MDEVLFVGLCFGLEVILIFENNKVKFCIDKNMWKLNVNSYGINVWIEINR